MTIHTALLPLPAMLTDLGLNVIALDGWDEAQGNYLWTDPDSGAQGYDRPPSGYMVHHSAGSQATPRVGGPGTGSDWSKANAWIGLDRGDGRLYQEGGGDPSIWLVSAGPARISSGYGFKPAAWDYTFKDLRGPAHATGSDGGTALNRYAFNMETVHRGDGGPIDQGVWTHVVGLGVALHELFGWEDRTIGHTGWTKRKIDPKWSLGGLPNDGADCIIDVQNAIIDLGAPIPPDPPIDPPPVVPDRVFPDLTEGDGFLDGPHPEYRPAVKALQAMLTHWGWSTTIDGAFGDLTKDRVQNYQYDRGLTIQTGSVVQETWIALNGRPWPGGVRER